MNRTICLSPFGKGDTVGIGVFLLFRGSPGERGRSIV